jgi:hypothetical protein
VQTKQNEPYLHKIVAAGNEGTILISYATQAAANFMTESSLLFWVYNSEHKFSIIACPDYMLIFAHCWES